MNERMDERMNEYTSITHDITATGWKSKQVCIEIGSRGLMPPQNKYRLKEIRKFSYSAIGTLKPGRYIEGRFV